MSKKRIVYFVPVLLLFLSAAMAACGVSSPGISDLGIRLADVDGDPGAEVYCFAHPGGDNYLFLPAGAYDNETRFVLRSPGAVRINDIAVKNNKVNDIITRDGSYTVSFGKNDFTLNVLSSSNLPALFIDTASGGLEKIHADKAYKEAGQMRVLENGVFSPAQELSVKGRGNTTWRFDKKSYNIKLTEASSLLGMDAAKKWCLLANAADPSLIRTDIAFGLANELDLPFTCDCRHADVYINGEYQGNYLVTEAVQTAPGRVEITDLEELNEAANPGVIIEELPLRTFGEATDCGNKRWTEIPQSPEDISGGYLLEYDDKRSYDEGDNGFITVCGQYVTVKSPNRASADEIDYISRFVNEAEEALLSEDGYNADGHHFSEYYDISSLAKMYVLNEYLYNGSFGCPSAFFSKDAGGKLIAGPAWDYDESIGNPYDPKLLGFINPGRRFLMSTFSNENLFPTVYSLALRHEQFVHEISKVWKRLSAHIAENGILSIIQKASDENAASSICDYFRWSSVVLLSPEEREAVYREQYIAQLKEFLDARTVFAEREFNSDPSFLFYDCGDVTCAVLENTPTYRGDQVTVKGIEDRALKTELPEEYHFREWNTKKDGSGKPYFPGDTITLDRLSTILYAQWDAAGP